MSLANKRILVTGGSRGIGAGLVKVLVESGASVAFTYSSRPDAAEAVLSEAQSGRKNPSQEVFYVPMNLADEASVESAMNQILERWQGEISGLVNNAGITKDQLLVRMKTEDFDSVIQTNLRGAFFTSRLVAKAMMKLRSGSIVNVTSVVGQMGNAGQSNYAASKAGLIGYSKSLALELASRNIRVNCVAPGFIQTEMTEVLSEDQKKKIIEKVPLGTMGQVQDVAYAVKFLLSDESRYITGHTLSVNGGLYLG